MGIVMIGLGGLGVFFGSILLLMLVGFWIMAYYYHKRKRCPSCERLILDSAYLVCPFCGKRLKDEFGQPIE
jgi:4-hydroxybenzoate polyprenyltransferase